MPEIDQLSVLIGLIYDTILDDTRWTEVLENATGFMAGKAAMLGLQSGATRTGNAFYSWGDDPKYTQLYFTEYIKINPAFVPVNLQVGPGDVFSVSTVMPWDEFCRSRMYIEWVKPQGYGDTTQLLIEKSASSFSFFAIAHGAEIAPADDQLRHRMRSLAPHICRAVAISNIIDLHKFEASMLADAVDGVAAGVFLVRADGTITYMNASATEMVRQANVLHETGRVLRVVDAAAQKALSQALTAAAGGDSVLDRRGMTIPLTARDGERFVAHVLSLVAGQRRKAGTSYAAVAAIFVHKAIFQTPTLVEAVAKQFQLTPAELRVLFAIIEVGGTPQVAAALGISQDTVKVHLKRVFAKTGTNRQADLVKLVSGYANPLV
jgi:DNA-binding CsgD family transcriptional regulator/PAS domain-containing protein